MTQTRTPAQVETYTFAVYPSDLSDRFDSFLIDVPTLSGHGAAARRAWWQVFHLLGPRGIEPEDYSVCCWIDNAPGPLVTMGGIDGAPRTETEV